jgi:uncharacterized protein (TIGR00299 family) protein
VLDPVGGIAGDMLLAALLHAGAPRAALDDGLRRLGLPITLEVSEAEVSGIRSLHVEVRAPHEDHHHRPWSEIRDLIARAGLPPRAAQLAQDAFALLARAEGRVHGVPPEEVEFHEVGALDSIADVVGAALLVDALGPERMFGLPPPSGGGTALSAHGVIPVPAPAVVEVLRGRPMRPSGPGERTTPTGAAMLAAWTLPADALPELAVESAGYGAGTRRWPDAPNLLRVLVGKQVAAAKGEAAWVLEVNLDDLSPQLLAVALEAALVAGAADAWVAPLTMKKGRPGHLLGALVSDAARPAVEASLFRETSTLGLRASRVERSVLERELVEVQTPYGAVRVKVGRLGDRALNVAPEFEDCKAAAERAGVPVKEVVAAALAAFSARHRQ